MTILGEDPKLLVNHPIHLLEVPNMLQTRMKIWKNAKHREWRQEGEAKMLLKLMHRKFGQVPDAITEKVNSAESERIETWGENILFANSLDDVFAS